MSLHKKGFVLKKDNDIDDLRDIKEYFEDSNKYLTNFPKVKIGSNVFRTKKRKEIISSEGVNAPKKTTQEDFLASSTNNQIMLGKNITLVNKSNNTKKNLKISSSQNNIFGTTDEKVTKKQLKVRPKSSLSVFSINNKKEKYIINKNNHTIKNHFETNKIQKNKTDIITTFNTINNGKLTHREKGKNHYISSIEKTNNNENEKNNNADIHYKYKSLQEMLEIFCKSKKREELFISKGTNDLIPKEVSDKVRKKFMHQEKILEKKMLHKNKSDFFSKYLSKKCDRKEENLLFNSIEDYRLKRQMIDYIDKIKPLRAKYGDNYWLFTLRRAEVQKNLRKNYVNIGTDEHENWVTVIDFPDKDLEIINNPEGLLKNKNNMITKNNKNICLFRNNSAYEIKSHKKLNLKKKNNLIKNSEIYDNDVANVLKLNEMKIEGKNLVKKEFYKVFSASDIDIDTINSRMEIVDGDKMGKLKVYKDPFEKKIKCINDFVCKENYDLKGKPPLKLGNNSKILNHFLRKNKAKIVESKNKNN